MAKQAAKKASKKKAAPKRELIGRAGATSAAMLQAASRRATM